MMSEPPTEEEGRKFLNWIMDRHPGWREKIIAMMEARGDDPLRIIASLCCWTLEQGEHMSIPTIPELLDDFVPAGVEMPCPHCGQSYILAYPGQPYCGNVCADAARASEQQSRESDPAELAMRESDTSVGITAFRPRGRPRKVV